MQRATSPKVRSLLMAAIMTSTVLATLFVAAPAAEATHYHSPAPSGQLQVFRNTTGIPMDQDFAFKVKIQNPYGRGITGVEEELGIWQFVFSVNPLDTPAGTTVALKAGDSRSILPRGWVPTSTADCNGPNVSPDDAACTGIVFTAPEDQELHPGGFIEFELTIFITGFSTCDPSFPLRIVGVHTKREDPPSTYFRSTNTHYFDLHPDEDLAPPRMVEEHSFYVDEDHNGHLDHVYAQFDKPLDLRTRDVRDFDVGRSAPDEYPVLSMDVMDSVLRPAGVCFDDSLVKIRFDEEDRYDTGPDSLGTMPQFKFKRKALPSSADPILEHVLTGKNGQRVESSEVIYPADRAPPRIVSAITKLDEDDITKNTDVLITFSEPLGISEEGCVVGEIPTLLGINAWHLSLVNASKADETVGAYTQGEAWGGYPRTGEPQPHDPSQKTVWFHFNTSRSMRFVPNGGLEERHLEYRFSGDGASNEIELNPQPHRVLPRSANNFTMCDASGNPVYIPVGTEDDPWEPIAAPTIVSVDGNIGFNKVTVRFNTPVNITDEQLAAPHEVFDVINGRLGPTGVVDVEHVKGSDRFIVTLNGPLTPLDVSGDPTALRLAGGSVFAAFTGRERRDPGWSFVGQERPILDVTPPSILHAFTRDIDGNGEVDGYDLVFSEPVDDLSFVQGSCGQSGVILCIEDHKDYERFDETRGTGLNDQFLTIRFKPINSTEGYRTHRIPQLLALQQNQGGDDEPTLVGLIKDLAVNPETGTGNWMLDVTIDELQEKDRALPRVMRAQAIDRDENGRLDAYVTTFSEPIKDSSFNKTHWFIGPEQIYNVTGFMPIGGDNEWDFFTNDPILVIEFDEKPINPYFPVGDTGSPLPELIYRAPVGAGIEDQANLAAEFAGPNRMLNFQEGKIVEEDFAPPVLMAALGCVGADELQIFFSEGVVAQDNPSAPVRGLREPDLKYFDGNGQGVSGFVADSEVHASGSNLMLLRGGGDVLKREDFGVDKVAVTENPELVDQDTGFVREKEGAQYTTLAQVTLGEGRDITPPEPVTDLSVVDGSVTAASVELEFKIPDDEGCVDRGVVDYEVRVSPTSLTPETFGAADRWPEARLSYRWYDPSKEMNFTDTPRNLLEQRLVGVGETLRLRLVGLRPDTQYQIALKPLDRQSNAGDMSNVVEIKTGRDTTPPVLPDGFEIRSPTHPRGVPVKNPLPQFEWDAAGDPESVSVLYHFAVNQRSDYRIDPAKDLRETTLQSVNFTPQLVAEFTDKSPYGFAPRNWYEDPAVWYLHVAGCSGGGCSNSTSYRFLVDAPVNRTEMRDFNQKIETKVTFLEETGQVVVEWQAPTPGQDDPCRTLAGVQVWRRNPGEGGFKLLGTFGDNDATFREGRFVDENENGTATKESRYLVTLRCPSTVQTYWDGRQMRGGLLDGAGTFPTQAAPNTTDYEGTSAALKEAPFRVPLWAWIVLALVALLAIAGIVLYLVVRRGGETELWEQGELDEETRVEGFGTPDAPGAGPPGAEGAAGAAGAAAGAAGAAAKPGPRKVHDVKCPACQTQFKAEGEFPLKITCPSCGTSGTLR